MKINRRKFAGTAALAPLALLFTRGQSESAPLALCLDAGEHAEEIEIDARAWRKVAKATMEMDLTQLGGFGLRVGDKVKFGTPIMSAVGIVTAVHSIVSLTNINYAFAQASVRQIEIHDINGGRFGPISASLHVNGVERSGCCTRVTVIEATGDGPPRDAVALATERHELKMEWEALEKERTRRGVMVITSD